MFELFFKGGAVMFFLFLCSSAGIYIIVHKFIYFNVHLKPIDLLIKQTKQQLASYEQADVIKRLNQKGVLGGTLIAKAIDLSNRDEESIKQGIQSSTNQEVPKLEKNLPILSSLITIAPILGLMGTVLGLIDIFNVISGGGIGDTQALSGGIAQALISTVTGLGIAIPFILCHHYLMHRVDSFLLTVEPLMTDIIYHCKHQQPVS